MTRKYQGSGLDLGNTRLQNLADGTAATDAVTLQQLQAAQRGTYWKDSVRAASTANVAVASALVNGSSMDGVTLATGDRVLLKNQTTASENGIYVVVASGAASRSTDADANTEIRPGIAVMVQEGTVNHDTAWILTTDGAITLGTTSLAFSQFGGGGATYTQGNGITISGGTVSVNPASGGGIAVAAGGVSVDSTVPRKYVQDAGGSTSITITHNLGNKDVVVAVRLNSDDTEIECDVTHTSVNVVTLGFAVAPAASAVRVVVIG